MPDNIDLLLTPTKTLERTMSLIKGGFSHRLASKLPVWQRSYTEHRIRDRHDHLTHIDYIHHNQSGPTLHSNPNSTSTLQPLDTVHEHRFRPATEQRIQATSA